ncbi:MAG TPA: M50 family metallopeptidase [Patescibacteria group bacterium]|jgi:regulator of sigma E protease|nr:M50 family metallopeptidase [Patescibacteria group bacterium]
MFSTLITIIVFLVILSVLVLIHEAGHFFVAKLFGIKVEEFGFGFPLTRPIFSFKKGETQYSFYPALIGGFVKLYGEDEAGAGRVSVQNNSFSMKEEDIQISSDSVLEEDIEISEKITISKKNAVEDSSRAFFAKPIWQRAIVIFAGAFMNFVLAVVIISFLFSVVGAQMPGNKVIVDMVVKGASAAKAGIVVGDTIVSVDKISVSSTEQLATYAKKHLGQKLTLEVSSQKSVVRSLIVTPRKVYPANEGPMGIAISQNVITKKYPWYEAPFVGTKEALHEIVLMCQGLVTLVSQLIFHASVPAGVTGPVGIAQLTGIFCSNTNSCLSFISLISLNLAIINILPIPALDGGRLLFIVIEGVFRKKVSAEIEARAHMIGMIFLLGLIALITLHDLFRILTGQPIIPK